MEFELGHKVINIELLEQEMSALSTWLGFKESDEFYYAIVSDLSEQSEIQAVFDAHDHTQLTEDQKAEIARQALHDEAVIAKASWPVIQSFINGLEMDIQSYLAGGGTPSTLNRLDPLNQTYGHWRLIFDALSEDMKVRVMWYGYMTSTIHEFYPEPETPTAAYKAWFNHSCSQVIGYMTDRAQM